MPSESKNAALLLAGISLLIVLHIQVAMAMLGASTDCKTLALHQVDGSSLPSEELSMNHQTVPALNHSKLERERLVLAPFGRESANLQTETTTNNEAFRTEENGWELQTRLTKSLINWYRGQLLPEMTKNGVIRSPLKQAFREMLAEIKKMLHQSGRWRVSDSRRQNMNLRSEFKGQQDVLRAIDAMDQACTNARLESGLDPSVFKAWDDLWSSLVDKMNSKL